MEIVDAVVIGAGVNGLVGANLLADAGWDVIVLEAAQTPGGAVRTEEIAAPGYRSDLGSSFYPMAAVSPVLTELRLEEYGLRWRRAPSVLAHVLPDDRVALLSTDLERTARSLAAFAPGDGEAWGREFDRWRRIRGPLVEALMRPFPPVRAGSELLRTLGAGEALRFARSLMLPARRLCEERFTGEGARVLMAGNAMHSGLGPDQAGSGLFGWLLCMIGQDVGFPVPEGGAASLIDALAARLAARGGRIECGRPVAKVLHARGIAVGVRDAEGTPVRARRAVLADVTAPSLYRDLVGEAHLPAGLRSDLAAFEWDPATLKVEWALEAPVPWKHEDAATAGTVHLGTDLDGFTRAAAELDCGLMPSEPLLLMGQMTTADPTRSPPGTETAWVYTRAPRGVRWTADRLRRSADLFEQLVERHAPGFADRIAGRAVRGPADLQDMDANLVEGAINGGTAAVHQQLVFRPVPGMGRADTVIDRLYLAGASAHPGGAVHGAPGANAARAALARAGRAGGLYRAAVDAIHRRLYS